MHSPDEIERALERVLLEVQKPGRYTGGEYNQIVKDWGEVPFRVAIGFPDIYDLSMSSLGIAILYDVINQQPDMLAERVFLPWIDMEDVMKFSESAHVITRIKEEFGVVPLGESSKHVSDFILLVIRDVDELCG